MSKVFILLVLSCLVACSLCRTPYHPASRKGAMFCRFRGRYYVVGDVFPLGDGCNRCTCLDGKVGCTANYCNL